MTSIEHSSIEKIIFEKLERRGIRVKLVSARSFPGETIVVASVDPNDYEKAVNVTSELDEFIENGFVTIRRSAASEDEDQAESVSSINDEKVTQLIELLNERSRTSETQPALRYIQDVSATTRVAITKRNHLIFGRRGVGKTALMLEARGHLVSHGASAIWVNMQSLRGLDAPRAALTVAERLCELPETTFSEARSNASSLKQAKTIKLRIKRIQTLSAAKQSEQISALIPDMQRMLQIFNAETQSDVFIFLDDIHYLDMQQQAEFLDLVHGISRDAGVWIKASGIRHQMRYFRSDPPIGLEPGHDAAIIDLNNTSLEEPAKARDFLTAILRTYLDEAKIRNLSGFISGAAIDRLVLASGAVPRDFLVLCATTIQVARRRQNARVAGVQDVNEAAGETVKTKLQELEDDAVSSGSSRPQVKALEAIRNSLLNEQHCTFFLISFSDKESHVGEYRLLQSLMDLRMLHLIRASLSDSHVAGRRYEVFMLDLSQFSGSRFKQKLRVLDFQNGKLIQKNTGSKDKPKIGDTPGRLMTILRGGASIELSSLTGLLN